MMNIKQTTGTLLEGNIVESKVEILKVESDEDLKKFISLPYKIYQNDQFWPGQDDDFEFKMHKPETCYPLNYLDTQLFLAFDEDGDVIGRISATINEFYNKRWNQNIGFFGHFESIDCQEVANRLLEAAECWVKERGKDEIYGPFNYTYYGIIGFVIQGFDDRPTIDLPYNPDYYNTLVEKKGYKKIKDLYEVLGSVDEFYKNATLKFTDVEDMLKSGRFSIRKLDESKLHEELLVIGDLYNDSFSQHWAFHRLDTNEWMGLMDILYPHLPNELFFIVEDMGVPVGFFFGQEDYNEVLYNKRFGIKRKPRRVKAFVMGVKEGYKKMGVSKILFSEIAKAMNELEYTEVSFSWIDEKNIKSYNMCTQMGGPVDKIFRIYNKIL